MADDAPLTVDPSIYAPPKAEDIAPPVEVHHARPPLFFAVSPLKLVVMSLVTLGFYELFWFYANWQRIRRRGQRVSPFWRTVFSLFFIYALFKLVKQEGANANVDVKFPAGLLATGWVITSLLWRLPDPVWLVTYAAVFFLLPVQKAMNDVNRALYPGHDPNTRFTAWNIVGIALGAPTLLLAIWGTFQPD